MNPPASTRSYPTESDVTRIAALHDPAARNTQITEAYWQLSAETERRILGHANWCTFATWASRQAGVTIRHEDLADTLRERLQAWWKISGLGRILIGAPAPRTGPTLRNACASLPICSAPMRMTHTCSILQVKILQNRPRPFRIQ